uniref:RING-type domain-containing protein n=1 Tax=Leersia perrieri TaxID=77586 RepID=A0A0D9XFD6_9ORYZ
MEAPARRGVTLAEQMAASSNLRDLLKLRDDDDDDGVDGEHAVRHPPPPVVVVGRRRTLLDVIRGEHHHHHRPSSASATPAAPPPRAAAARVSLMALLEQAERQWSAETPAAVKEEGKHGVAGGGGVGGRCCVCMARGKGAAFIPCGHTFCRACAGELRAARGRCPLCNAAIHDVLNLF